MSITVREWTLAEATPVVYRSRSHRRNQPTVRLPSDSTKISNTPVRPTVDSPTANVGAMTVGQVARNRVLSPHQTSRRIFQAQMICAVIIFSAVGLSYAVGNRHLDSAPEFLGLIIAVSATIASATIDWERVRHRWTLLLPIIDIVAIVLLSSSAPYTGLAVLLIVPIIWMAASFGMFGTIAGPMFAAISLFGAASLHYVDGSWASLSATDAGAFLSLLVVLSATALAIGLYDRRDAAERALLRRQTALLETALNEVKHQEQTERQLLDAVSFGVVQISPNGAVSLFNRASTGFMTTLGFSPNTRLDQLPMYQADRVTPIKRHELPHIRAQQGDFITDEIFWLGHPGQRRLGISVTTRQLRGAGGARGNIVMVTRDITFAADAILAQDDLVSSVSHELRTPLTSILGFVDLAREDTTVSPEVRTMLDVAFNNADRLLSLVSRLLEAGSRNAAPLITLAPTDCDIAEILAAAVESIRPQAADRMVELMVPQLAPTTLYADPLRLRQVIDNLLSNALKYNDFGGRIMVELKQVMGPTSAPEVEFRIADTGRGMTEEEQRGLFQKFYRADSVRNSKIHGTGLGLNISKEIIDLHHGSITVQSETGRGTVMSVRLPRTSKDTN